MENSKKKIERPPIEVVRKAVEKLHIYKHPVTEKIFNHLEKGESSEEKILSSIRTDASEHLNDLLQTGFVICRGENDERFYSLNYTYLSRFNDIILNFSKL